MTHIYTARNAPGAKVYDVDLKTCLFHCYGRVNDR